MPLSTIGYFQVRFKVLLTFSFKEINLKFCLCLIIAFQWFSFDHFNISVLCFFLNKPFLLAWKMKGSSEDEEEFEDAVESLDSFANFTQG